MDWNNRKYYGVTFASDTQNMRIRNLKLIDGVKTRPFNNVPVQKDEKQARGRFTWMVSCPAKSTNAVVYELKKAQRNDRVCRFTEIQPKKRMLPEGVIQSFIEKVSNDSVENIESFLGYPISANIMECLDAHIRGILYYGLCDDEFVKLCKQYEVNNL